jgi:Domain of unknown function (DUF4365)
MKKLSNSDMIGKAGISLVGLRLSEIGFLFHETGSVEAGTDGFVEVRDPASGAMLSAVFRLQSKATKNGRAWLDETETSFKFTCKEGDIADWVASNVPVVLVCSDIARQTAYWKDVTAYFKEPANRESRHVLFDKAADALNHASGTALAAVAVPKSAGMHIPPPARKEELLSNLLPVIDYPKHLWVAPGRVTGMWEVEETLREGAIGVECFLRGHKLYSFRPFEEPAWVGVCDVEAAERFDSADWAESNDLVRQHEFAELLRRALGEKVRDSVDYDRKQKLFFFRAPDDLSDVRLPTGRRAFRVYRKRDGSTRFCRHLGFRGQFLRLDDTWYLEISPDYRFTRDGHAVSRFQGENISKMKRLEHNDAVRQQVQALAAFFNQPPTLLTPAYRYLSFGSLLSFEVGFGFDEAAWAARDQQEIQDTQLFDVA